MPCCRTPGSAASPPSARTLRDPAAVLADQALRKVVDPAEPICVLLGLVLHYTDAAAAREVTAGYAQRLARGSCIVITVPRFDDLQLFDQVRGAYTPAVLHNHTREDVASFLAGLDLIRPGVKPVAGFRPGWDDALQPSGSAYVLGGIRRKPADRLRPARRLSQKSTWCQLVAGPMFPQDGQRAIAEN